MSSSKALLAALCVLSLTLPLHGQKRDDSRSQYPSQNVRPSIPNEIGGKTFKQWMADLSHHDPSVRANAITVIPGFGEGAYDAVPLLVDRTHDKDASPRVKAVLAFQLVGIRGTDVPRVVKALGERISSDTQAIVRYEAAKALRRFGPDTREVILDLVKGVGDGSTWEVREACIITIMGAGVDEKKGPDPRVTDAMLQRLTAFGEATQVRLEAVIALGAMGRPQNPQKLSQVVTQLKALEKGSTNKVIKIWAHVSLMALEDKVNEKYLKIIAGYLGDRERDIRAQAVTALGALEGKAHDYVPDILKLLKYEKEPSVMMAACNALARMGDRSQKVLNAIIKLTQRDDAESTSVVLTACTALGQIGVASPDVIDAMKKVLDRKDLKERSKDIVRKALEEVKKPKDDTKPKEDKKPKDPPKKKGR